MLRSAHIPISFVFVTALLLAASAASHAAPAGAQAEFTPDPATVVRYGAAYRYPQAGWIVLHIEGAPYDRGYQHGRLLWREIVETIGCLAKARGPKGPEDAWRLMRSLANALFLRRYDPEYLEEMRGIADGAAAAGAKFDDRPIDLVDIVTINSDIEAEFLEDSLEATANGLEGRRFVEPPLGRRRRRADDHCSAFAATAPATADGKIVFGHITMFQLVYVPHYNVWLDVQPKAGHRVVMQSFPGGMMSGLDYYLNDAGLLICETTIEQTGFDAHGAPVASRIRQAAQHADSIDAAIDILRRANNGLYTNEWLLADINTNEIAMFELGTARSKLWRSSKNQWVADTKGFYWGCNNTKDLEVRAEMLPSLAGKPGNLVFHPEDRDRAWLRLFGDSKGRIDEGFGFQVFSTPPIVGSPSCDAKFTTTALAKDLKTWALFGPPMGRTWEPRPDERDRWSGIRPLVANDWTVLTAAPPAEESAATSTPADAKPEEDNKKHARHDNEDVVYPPAWHGTLLPASDADVWLAAAFSDYEKIIALEQARRKAAQGKPLEAEVRDEIELSRFVPWTKWLAATRRLGRDLPLAEVRFDWRSEGWYDLAAGKGVMLLAALREKVGADEFDAAMDRFGREHAGKEVSTEQFLEHLGAKPDSALGKLCDPWLHGEAPQRERSGNFWAIDSYDDQREQTLIVYGTVHDVNAQREAAKLLQRQIARTWSNLLLPTKADTEVTDEELANNHLLLIGRPATNALAARWAEKLPVEFASGSFTFRSEVYSHPATAIIAAGENPASPRFSLVVFAGLSADATWHVVQDLPKRDDPWSQTILRAAGHAERRLGAERFALPAEKKKTP
ncbi:MAG TPA: C45 family autoproteolytic acyltransferase/hydrolase [Pirellulales bacterium]|nr:C45 family autoproteolytic acyltransferase/hydrolase [Pirellulales bacterium]